MTNQEKTNLIEALCVIKKTCEGHAHCEDCPLAMTEWDDTVYCMVGTHRPEEWNIKVEEEPEKWRAFN